ncbi:MAG: hypothetical protein GY924_24990 [Planctomycetaceae bacterium]|nr:hypothetical protein [Planctomycetaceae bacterium]
MTKITSRRLLLTHALLRLLSSCLPHVRSCVKSQGESLVIREWELGEIGIP